MILGLSLGLVVQPQLVSAVEKEVGFTWSGSVFIILCAVGLVLAIALKIYDWKKMNNVLDHMKHDQPNEETIEPLSPKV